MLINFNNLLLPLITLKKFKHSNMKHLNIFLVAILFTIGVGVSNAQDKNNPWSIEVGVNAVDFFPIEKTDDGRFPATTKGGIFTEYFNANDHWNMVPTLSELK